jgi:hypothetical protein
MHWLLTSLLDLLVALEKSTPAIRIGLIRCRGSGTPVLSHGS